MGLIAKYERLPWFFQATVPFILLGYILIYIHLKLALNFFESLGVTFSVFSSSFLVFHLIEFIYENWIGVLLGHNVDLKKLGSWAVVTGTTQGIGKAYANALAKRGLNIVLISRSKERLEEVAEEIKELHSVQVKTIAVDFTKGLEIYEEIGRNIKGLDIGILINNVGMSYSSPEYFSDLSASFCRDLLNCNMLSVTMMTRLILPEMAVKRKGAVVNVGSFSSLFDTPYLSLYGASKAFVDKLTLDLECEYQDLGVIFQSVIPGYIVSNMSKVKKSNYFVPTPDDFVEAALNMIGIKKRTSVCITHQFFHLLVHIGTFFRRGAMSMLLRTLGKQFWFYGKKVMMYRDQKEKVVD